MCEGKKIDEVNVKDYSGGPRNFRKPRKTRLNSLILNEISIENH
jgi:hypothetical protein